MGFQASNLAYAPAKIARERGTWRAENTKKLRVYQIIDHSKQWLPCFGRNY
jgi:hypothetical protein